MQNTPSSQGALFGGCTQLPPPLHTSEVQRLPSSSQGVPAGSRHVRPASSQVSAQSRPSAHGSPAWPLQAPPLQTSSPLQNTPSSQETPLAAGWVQAPAPSHTSSVQTLPSSAQALPPDSSWQVEEQQSPPSVLPSSHCSPGSTTPLPHTTPSAQKPPG